MTADKDYYEVLGIDPKADAETIKKAYRNLAKQYHPDANPNNPEASERFKEVGEANSVLSDPRKRATYDRMRKRGAFGLGGAPGARPGAPQSTSYSFEDLGGIGGLSDIFSSVFDRWKEAARRPSGPAKGADVEHTLEVPFLVSARGGEASVSVSINEECATCRGSGGAPGTTWELCPECGGSGSVSFGQGEFAISRPCPACVGRGRRADSICHACGGDGKIHQNRNIQVAVPAGAVTGSKVRLTGRGARGTEGGAPGDLVITFKVLPHRFFRREGNDIHVTVPVNLVQATLGSLIRVNTISGRKVVLRIPPGTQPGTRFKIRGQGISRGGRRGDQYVEVKVEVPASLTEEQQEQLRGFAHLAGMKW